MSPLSKINKTDSFFMVAIALMAILVLIKSIVVDMTHDEAYSFYNVKHFWWVEALCTGNTHWFNFAAIKLAVICGFEKAGQLRWFTVLSAFAFFYVAFLWIRSFKFSSIKFLAFTLLLLNPYMLDYFSLARGYATGMAFQALSLLFFYKALKEERKLFSLLALGFGGMSAIANFNFYYFFVGISAVYFFRFYFLKGPFFRKRAFYMDSIYFIGISALVLKALWFITDCSNDIGPYGGDGFVDSLFSGYVKGWIYGKYTLSDSTLKVLSYVVMLLVVAASSYGVLAFKRHQNRFYQLISIILLSMYVLCIVNRNLFQVLYPVDRTTLMFFPLMALVVVYFIAELIERLKFFLVLALVLSAGFTANFLAGFRVDSTYDYKQQIDARESFELVEELNARKVGISGDLYGVYRNYYQLTDEQSFSFHGEYIETNHPKGLDEQGTGLKEYDYLILYPPYDLGFYRNNRVKFLTVKMFPKSGTLILKVISI